MRAKFATAFGVFFTIWALYFLFYGTSSTGEQRLLGTLVFGGLAAYMFYSAKEHRRWNISRPKSQIGDSTGSPHNGPKSSQDAERLQLSVDQLASTLAGKITTAFSASRFHSLFDDEPMASNWTISDALAVWYALGYFCFLSAVGSIDLEGEVTTAILNRGYGQLVENWKMPEVTHEQFQAFVKANLNEILAAYEAAEDASKLFLFFEHFTSKVLGHEISFSPRSLFETLLLGGKFNENPVLASSVGKLFMFTSGEVKGRLLAQKRR